MITAQEARKLADKNGALLEGIYASIEKAAQSGLLHITVPIEFGDVDLLTSILTLKDKGYHMKSVDNHQEGVRRVYITW